MIRSALISLLAVLDSILRPAGLNYYLDDWNHLFLSDSTMLIAGLPEYEGVKETTTSDEEDQEDSGERELTSAEQHYIDGKRLRVLEASRQEILPLVLITYTLLPITVGVVFASL